MDSNSYETPQYIFDHFNKVYNFNYDLACTQKNRKANFLSEDTLKEDWHSLEGWQWLNPPYKPLKPWIEKAYKESKLGAKIVMLVPLTTISNYYYSLNTADDLIIVTKRIFFEYEGKVCGGNRHNSCFLIYNNSSMMKKSVTFFEAR